MPEKSLKERFSTHDNFYTVMYTGAPPEDAEHIIEVKCSKVEFADTGQSFRLVWGFNGFNAYSDKTYGREWAYDKQVLLDYWGF